MSIQLLALSYALVAALLLNIWIATRWSTGFKVTIILLTTSLYVGTYLGLTEMQGWPTTDPMPESFRLLWAKIDEPEKTTASEGRIYLWVQELDVAERITGQPRAYSLPFEPDLAEEVEAALNKVEEGALLNGRMTRGLLKEESGDENQQANQQVMDEGDSDATGLGDGRILLEFTEMPKTPLPAKAI